MRTGETLYEDAHDYSGRVAECKSGGLLSAITDPIFGKAEAPSVTGYAQSAEQAEVYRAFLPTLQRLGLAGQGTGAGLYDIPGYPAAPTAPSMQGVLSGVPQYQIPNIQQMMPSQDWYSNLAPEVLAGIRQPYQEASQQLTESLGYSAGTPMAGASGVLGGSQADFWSKAAPQMGMQAWNMIAPAMQAGWGAQLGQNVLGQQQLQQERQADYQNILAQQQAGYGGQQQVWQQQLQRNIMPYSIIPGLLGGTYSTPIINPGDAPTSPMTSALGMGAGAYGAYKLMAALAPLFSSKRYKKNINRIGNIEGLGLYSYEYTNKALAEKPNMTKPGIQIGFMAEEVADKYPEAVVYDSIGRPDAINYGILLGR